MRDDVFIPIRIIETDDFDLRAKITEYLNSQSKIKDSYFLANNTFIKELQQELITKGYFLERLSNEYSYKRNINKINEYPKENILQLEKTIQIYVAFYNNTYAATAKRGKNDLFNRDLIDLLISKISAEKVLTAYRYYNLVCEKITLYRQCRRSKSKKTDFLNFVNCSYTMENYDEQMLKYIFMNTADLLLLNAFANLKNNTSIQLNDQQIIRTVIEICENVVAEENSKMLASAATKNTSIFNNVQEKCKNYN